MSIGKRIRDIRENKGISQTDLAKKILSTKQTIYKYENGIITNIPSDKIEAIANILQVSPAYLMGWEDENADLSKQAGQSKIDTLMEQLNEEGQEKVENYAADLIDSGKYKKHGQPELGQKEA